MSFLPLVIGAVGAVGSIIQGISQANALEYQAKVADQNAQAAAAQAASESERIGARGRQIMGAQRAAIAANGLVPTGTPLKILADTVANVNLDRMTALYQGQLRSRGYQMDAASYRMDANTARTSGYIGAAKSAFMGLNNAGYFDRQVPGFGGKIGSYASKSGGKL